MSTSRKTGSPLPPLLFIVLAGAASLVALPWSAAGPPAEAPRTSPPLPFHAAVEPPADLAGTAFCSECHLSPPHEGEGIAPAFYNEHTSFVECLVCHWARRSGEVPEPAWRKNDSFMSLGVGPPDDPPVDALALREQLLPKQPCFDRGLVCASCHRRGAMEPYVRPGLTPQAQAALENLPEIFTLSSGTKWYFPQRQ